MAPIREEPVIMINSHAIEGNGCSFEGRARTLKAENWGYQSLFDFEEEATALVNATSPRSLHPQMTCPLVISSLIFHFRPDRSLVQRFPGYFSIFDLFKRFY